MDYPNLRWPQWRKAVFQLNSFGEETISDDVQNYDDVGKLSNTADRDSGSISDRYSDVSDDRS